MSKTTSSPFTRRKALMTISLGSGALVLPGMAMALVDEDAEMHLRARLETLRLPVAPARLDLLKFTRTEQAGVHHLRALIRLTWAPGLRQQYFSAHHSDLETALATLVVQLYQSICAATPPGAKRAGALLV